MDLNNIKNHRERLKSLIICSNPVPLNEEHLRLCKLEFDYEVNNFFNEIEIKANLNNNNNPNNIQIFSCIHSRNSLSDDINNNNKSKNKSGSRTFSEKDSLSEIEENIHNNNNNNNYNNNNNNNKDVDVDDYIKYINNFKSFKFEDEYVPRYYKCSDVPFYKKNHFKALVSNQRIRFIDNDFDLDLM
jgi:hypothetical protein